MRRTTAGLLVLLSVFVVLAGQASSKSQESFVPPPPPAQPIPYSHKQHLALGLQCRGCHTMPDPGDAATFPATATCMSCHSGVKADSPAIERLSSAQGRGEAIPWVRVYRLPSYVFFSHKTHLERGVATCETCHGAVREMDAMQKVKDTSMAACVDCHKDKNGPTACDSCHDPR